MKALFAKIAAGGTKAKIIAAAVAIVVLGGGVAAAYYGIVLPNKPENVVKKSIENQLKQTQFSGKGKATFTAKEQGQTAVINYGLQGDSEKNAAAGQVDVSVSGIKVPFEFRAVDKALYIKFGDLGTISSLAAGFGGAETGAAVQQLASQVSNKWIEFDESLLKSATADKCSILTQDNKLSDEQIDKILEVYDKNEFVTVKESGSETIDGKELTKYELGLDKEKAKAFGKDLEQVEQFKKLKECAGDDANKPEEKAEDFKGSTSFTVWIDKGEKKLVKFALAVNDDKEGKLDADFTFNNEKVDITKPDGAVPALQIFGELGPLLGGFTGTDGADGADGAPGMDGADGAPGLPGTTTPNTDTE